MSFGLKGAPATFQRLMTTVLRGIQGIKCLVYLDDVVVFGEKLKVLLTVNEHTIQLERSISECSREYNLLIGAIMNSQKGILQPHIITLT